MKVNIELFKSKVLKDGTHPIMIRLSHNGKNKYISTNVSAKAQNWNKAKTRITCREKDYKIKNLVIQKQYQRITDRVIWFEERGYQFDYDFIKSDAKLESYNPTMSFETKIVNYNFVDIIQARINAYDKLKTKENYIAFKNEFIRLYGEYYDYRRINPSFAMEFRQLIDAKFPEKSNLKNGLMKCLNSSYKFGAENRWIENPFTLTFKKFPYNPRAKDLTHEEFTKIINCYKKSITVDWNKSENLGLALFILDIAMHGLSPRDLANIRIRDIQFIELYKYDKDTELYINDELYKENFDRKQQMRLAIKINTFRTKTQTFVPICFDFVSVFPILQSFIKGKTKDDYLISCFDANKQYTEKQANNRCGHYFSLNAKSLNSTMKVYCSALSTKEIPNITYYYARHAFINALDANGTNRHLIRKMVGHKDNTIDKSYLNKSTDWEQAEIIYNLFNSSSTIDDLILEKMFNNDRKLYEESLNSLISIFDV